MKPFVILEHAATADAMFQAFGKSLNSCFKNAAKAFTSLTIDNPKMIKPVKVESVTLAAEAPGPLLIAFLEELIFLKDTKHLVFSLIAVKIKQSPKQCSLTATLKGEKINPKKHQLGNDIKAITYHQFKLEQQKDQWMAQVLVDI